MFEDSHYNSVWDSYQTELLMTATKEGVFH